MHPSLRRTELSTPAPQNRTPEPQNYVLASLPLTSSNLSANFEAS